MKVPGKVWKWLGVAGVAGVAAGGVVVARDQRRRTSMTPEQVRKQLRRRVADLDRDPEAAPPDPGPSGPSGTAGQTPTRLPIKRRGGRG